MGFKFKNILMKFLIFIKNKIEILKVKLNNANIMIEKSKKKSKRNNFNSRFIGKISHLSKDGIIGMVE